MTVTKSVVTLWIQQFRDGDPTVLERLWRVYWPRVVRSARSRLKRGPRRVADEEDIAQRAWFSLWRAASQGRVPRLRDHESLWRLLQVIVKRTAINQLRHETRQKRGSGRVQAESHLCGQHASAGSADFRGLDHLASKVATPDMQASARETWQRLLNCLHDPVLRRIAVLKREAYTNQEIARLFGCARSTVVRKLAIIRQIWRREFEC